MLLFFYLVIFRQAKYFLYTFAYKPSISLILAPPLGGKGEARAEISFSHKHSLHLSISDRTDFSSALSCRDLNVVDKQHVSLAIHTSCPQGMAAPSHLLPPEARERENQEDFRRG